MQENPHYQPHMLFDDTVKSVVFKTNYRLMQVNSIAVSAILSTCINLPFVIKIFVLSIFERLFSTSFTVSTMCVTL